MNNEVIGIVVLNYITWEKTILCVQSIYETFHGQKEIVIVDNQSPNDSFFLLSQFYAVKGFENVTVIQTDRNGGFSYGNNFGFDYVIKNNINIDKVVITNNDIVFMEGAILALLSGFNYSDSVVLTAPTIFNPNGTKTNIPWKCKPNIFQEIGLKSRKSCEYTWAELIKEKPVYMVSGCCFAVRKCLFLNIDKLDDGVFLYNEENILSRKVNDNNLSIVYCPKAGVIHDHGSSTGNNSIFVDKEFAKSSIYYFKYYVKLNIVFILLLKIYFILRISLKLIIFKYNQKEGYIYAMKELMLYV